MKRYDNVARAIAVLAFAGALGLAANQSFAAPTTDANKAPAANPTRDAGKAPAANTTRDAATAPAGNAIATGPTPPSGTIALTDVPDAKNALSSIKIVDLKGDSVGSVDEIMFDQAGKPSAVKVDVGGFLGIGAKDVALDAKAVKFDPAKKVLVTTLSKEQLQAMPAYKSKS